ncbi:MAG TPA: class F sortase [Streptosporangiaceae bacterium]|nr:class F sortase [Streptosporangiaceae bacterium]
MPAIASPPEVPAWDVDADWWGPSWDVVTSVRDVGPERRRPRAPEVFDEDFPAPAASYVATPDPSWGRILATTVHLWISRRRHGAAVPPDDAAYPAHEPYTRRDFAPASVALPSPRAAPSPPALAPSHTGATALPSVEAAASPVEAVPAPVDSAVPSAAGPRLPGRRRPGVAGWASAAWGAHARLLSAAMLSAGLLAAGAGTAGLVVARTSSPPVRLAARPSPVAVPTGQTVGPVSLSAVQPTPKPVELTIPAIGVKAPIVNLGLNRNGTLQVPKTTTVAGWYTGSPAPGATGSAVIAGHVDSRTGPGIFFWLRKMRVGERIYVRRADGTLAVFTVTAVRIYTKSSFPTAMVYGPVPDAELRLITCGGTFDYARGSYLSNVVVYARMST